MSDVVLSDITSGYSLSKLNSNFDKIEQKINEETLHLVGGNNVMLQDLDMNSHYLLNLGVNPNDPNSLITIGVADQRYYNVSGDTLTGPMNTNGQSILNLKVATQPSEPVRKDALDYETNARVAADINQQAQMTGNVPLMASTFSEISWHGQAIASSVAIPDNKNAWSFGPTMSILPGQVVEIGTNSFWTIANGEESGAINGDTDFGTLPVSDGDTIDFGEL